MLRLFCLCALFLSVPAFSATFDPSKAPSTLSGDDAKVAWAFREACKGQGNTVDLSARNWVLSKPIVLPETDYLCLNIVGSGYWKNVEYTQKGYWLNVTNLKDSTWRNLGIVSSDSGIKIVCDGSSSRNVFDHLRVQCPRVGFSYEAIGNADVSATTFRDCEWADCNVGFAASGPNCLDLRFLGGQAQGCVVGYDLSQGGSNSVLSGIGASGCGEVVRVNAGYQLSASFTSIELCGTAIVIGGDSAGGMGAPGAFDLAVFDCRSTPQLLDAGTGGSVTLSALKSSGSVRLENRSDTLTAELNLLGAARRASVVTVGKCKVTGQQQAVID